MIFFMHFTASFHKQPVEIDLTLACIGELNTTIRGGILWPMIYGVGVNVKTGEIFPATFPDKGPDLPLRCAKFLTGVTQVSYFLISPRTQVLRDNLSASTFRCWTFTTAIWASCESGPSTTSRCVA